MHRASLWAWVSLALAFRSQGPGPIGVNAIFTMRSEEVAVAGRGTAVAALGAVEVVGFILVFVVGASSGKESGPEHG